jgi:hypothetical protein
MLHLAVNASLGIVFLEDHETPDDEFVDLESLDSSALYAEASDRNSPDRNRADGARTYRNRCQSNVQLRAHSGSDSRLGAAFPP